MQKRDKVSYLLSGKKEFLFTHGRNWDLKHYVLAEIKEIAVGFNDPCSSYTSFFFSQSRDAIHLPLVAQSAARSQDDAARQQVRCARVAPRGVSCAGCRGATTAAVRGAALREGAWL